LQSSSSLSLSVRQTSPVSYAFTYLSSPDTRRQYPRNLKLFFEYLQLPGDNNLEEQAQAFLAKATGNQQWVEEKILLFLDFHKQRAIRKEIASGTVKNFYRPIKTFYDAHDDVLLSLNWKRIAKSLPRAKTSSNDRVPTIEEICKLVENNTDRRIKPIVYTMASSGIRVGAWNYLRWKHITPIITNEKTGELVAAKLIVYAGEPEEYYTFITPEAYKALKDWMDFRASYGEKITGESLVMRNKWRTADVKRKGKNVEGEKKNKNKKKNRKGIGGRFGLATHPKNLPSTAIRKIIERALSTQGIRDAPLPEGVRRYEWKGTHGFRKFFETHAARVMSFINVELLMGHSIGLVKSYYKPVERDVLQDYLKAIDLLTINDNNKLTFQKLAQKEEQIDKEAKQKALEFEAMKARLESFERTEEVREQEMRRNIERTNQRLAEMTAGMTGEMLEIYAMLSKMTEKSIRINQIPKSTTTATE
jgi:hypothetical protein